MPYHNLIYTVEDQIACIQFKGTKKYNIYTLETEAELREVWDDISCRSDVRCVLFTGSELAFLTGSDLWGLNISDTAWMTEQTVRSQELFNRIANYKGPTLAAVNGYATGAGLQLALACDFRFATPQASFAAPEVRIGMIPSIGGTQRLARLIGMEQAKLMIFSGEKVSAKEAKQMGLVSRVVEADTLLTEAKKLLRSMAENAPVAIANSKTCINMGADMSLEQGLALERNAWLSLCMTEDMVEGIDAFLNKRKPEFKGR